MKKTITNNSKQNIFSYLKTIWDFRFFAHSLSLGEIKNKYAKAYTGVFLSLIQSLIGLATYWLIFGIAIKIDTGNIPYPVFVLPGIISWQFFSYLIGNSSGALINAEYLITKLYFPRITLILSKILPGLVDLAAGLVLFFILFLIFGLKLQLTWLYILPIFLFLLITGLAIGLWTSILSLYIRDLSQIIIQITNFLIFVTPVFYPGTIVPDKFRLILYLNPIAGIIEYSRAAFFNSPLPDNGYLIGFGIILLLFISAIFIFKRLEKKITDLL